MARKSVASLDQFVECIKEHPFVVGIDVHKRSLSVALLRVDGKVHTFVCPADPGGLLRLIERLEIQVSLMAQEAGPTGYGLARAFQVKRPWLKPATWALRLWTWGASGCAHLKQHSQWK